MGGFQFPKLGALPSPPQVGQPIQSNHGGQYGQNLGLMPYKPDTTAQTMQAFGNLMQGLGSLKQGQKQQAQQDFEQGLQLAAQGLTAPSPEKMAKLAKKAGLDKFYDFSNPQDHPPAIAPSQLGVAPASMMSPPVAQPPVGQSPAASAPMGASPPGVATPSNIGGPQGPPPQMAAPPPGIATPEMLAGPQGPRPDAPPPQAAPPPVPGSYTQGPQDPNIGLMPPQALQPKPNFMDKLKGGLYATTGIGSPRVNMDSAGARATQGMMQGAQQQGQMQRMMGGLQTQDAIGGLQEKIMMRDLLHGAVTGQDSSGKLLSPEAMLKVQTILTQKGVFQKLDLTDIPALQALSGAGFAKGDEDKLGALIWGLKDPKGKAEYITKLENDFRDRGMTEAAVQAAVQDRLANRPPSVAIPASIERSKELTGNEAKAIELFPGLEKVMKTNPTVKDLAQRGMFGTILKITDLRTKTTIEAENEQRKLQQGEQRIGLEGYNAATSRGQLGVSSRNADTSAGQLDLGRKQFDVNTPIKTAETALQIGQGTKSGAITPTQQEQMLHMIAPNIKGNVTPYEHNWLSPNQQPQLNANTPFPTQQKPAVNTGPGTFDNTAAAFSQYMKSGASGRIPFDIWVDQFIKNSTGPQPPTPAPDSPYMKNFSGN